MRTRGKTQKDKVAKEQQMIVATRKEDMKNDTGDNVSIDLGLDKVSIRTRTRGKKKATDDERKEQQMKYVKAATRREEDIQDDTDDNMSIDLFGLDNIIDDNIILEDFSWFVDDGDEDDGIDDYDLFKYDSDQKIYISWDKCCQDVVNRENQISSEMQAENEDVDPYNKILVESGKMYDRFLFITADASKFLAKSIENECRHIVEIATKMAFASKREFITSGDIDSAIKNWNPSYILSDDFSDWDDCNLYPKDSENLKEIVNFLPTEGSVEIPSEACHINHWLAVQGIQPNIDLNPNERIEINSIYNDNSTNNNKLKTQENENNNENSKGKNNTLSRQLNDRKNIILEALKERNRKIFEVVRAECGLEPLVPLFLKRTLKSIKNGEDIMFFLKFLDSLICNKSLNLTSYIISDEGKIMPALFQCSISKKMQTLSVRLLASNIIFRILTRYGDEFPQLYESVEKTFIAALNDVSSSFGSLCSAILALTILGSIEKRILPIFAKIINRIDVIKRETEDTNNQYSLEQNALDCLNTLVVSVGNYFNRIDTSLSIPNEKIIAKINERMKKRKKHKLYSDIFEDENFGEKLIPYCNSSQGISTKSIFSILL